MDDAQPDLLERAAQRLAEWSSIVADCGSSDYRGSVRNAASAAAYIAKNDPDKRWAVEASAALLGEDPPPPTEREALLKQAAEALRLGDMYAATVQRIVDAGWRPPAEGGDRG